MKHRCVLLILASGFLLSSSVSATTLTTPLLGIGTANYFFACYVLNAGKKTVDTSIQIINGGSDVLASLDWTLLPGGTILVANNAALPDIAYCKVDFKGPKSALRVSLCRATSVSNFAECSSAVVTAQ